MKRSSKNLAKTCQSEESLCSQLGRIGDSVSARLGSRSETTVLGCNAASLCHHCGCVRVCGDCLILCIPCILSLFFCQLSLRLEASGAGKPHGFAASSCCGCGLTPLPCTVVCNVRVNEPCNWAVSKTKPMRWWRTGIRAVSIGRSGQKVLGA